MTLWYNFGSDDYDEFEYDVSLSQLRNFFMSLPSEELVDAFQQAFEALPKEDQYAILDERGEKNFACPNYLAWIDDDKEWVISEFLLNNDILELFEDDLHDYFEEEAAEQWRDAEEYRKDPYAYNGVKRSDFY